MSYIYSNNEISDTPTALLYYDHFLTFSDEVSYIWRRPKSASSYWFFANRYLAFTGNIFIAIFGFRTLSVQVSGESLCFVLGDLHDHDLGWSEVKLVG
jgi:Family of unknown function (DUF6533)